jgi:aspartyl-tRNA(Asn)/glutamyl-tRNA(Gln) amidotransferase subunit A
MPLSFSLDTVGVLARDADDCALIGSLIVGADRLDPTTAGAPAWDTPAARRPPASLTIGVPRAFYVDDLEPDVSKALDEALATLRRLGARIIEVRLPDQTAINAACAIVLATEAAALHAPWLRERSADYGAEVRARLQNGLAYSAVEYLEALRWRGPALAAHLAAIGDVDVLIAPVARMAAPTLAKTETRARPHTESILQAITRFTRPINYLGLPALSVPAGSSGSGLPIGLQLIGRPFADETLIALGRAFQAVTDHHRRIPDLQTI